MKLQTKIPLSPSELVSLDYDKHILMLGSCFAQNMGEYMDYHKLPVTINPLGITFNPVALERQVAIALSAAVLDQDRWVESQDHWVHLDAHSSRGGVTRELAEATLKKDLNRLNDSLRNASVLFITLGTAWVYVHQETQAVVANCHKLPARAFRKELLSINAIRDSLVTMIREIRLVNAEVQFVFTVSPVRHLKDGFTENLRSKSHLIAAVLDLVDQDESVSYFPAYELLQDELRDYRFYAEDMVHPNTLAIRYVWERLVSTYASAKAKHLMEEIAQIQKGLAHQPFNPDSQAHQQFKEQLNARIERLQKEYSQIQF
ncbi:GSCFA domain-containing protein [Croceiramulus getboli]|nr:GSCFA domain-containing protein [Flavobacteriaceae bacterium YJPT1-3]